jgi:hypothetical protein
MCTHKEMTQTNLHFFFFLFSFIFFFACPWSYRHIYNCSVSIVCSRTRLWITCNICCWNLRRKKMTKPQTLGHKMNSSFSFVLFFSFYSLIRHCMWKDVIKRWRVNEREWDLSYSNGTTINIHLLSTIDSFPPSSFFSSLFFFM